MNKDVRMRGFTKRSPVVDALNWIDQLNLHSSAEKVALEKCHDRVLFEDISSEINVPGFRRSMMDGYAVQAADVQGADSYNPIPLSVVGQVLPGQNCSVNLKPGEAVQVMTGAEVPHAANSVVPVEFVNSISESEVQILAPVAEQKNVAKVGEDIAAGELVLKAGRKLRPQDIGLLASIGVKHLQCFSRPKVRIIVTGNELLPVGEKPTGVQIVDSNSVMLKGLIQRDGGESIFPGIIRDDPAAILDALNSDCDVILVAGGSSTGKEDFAPSLVAQHGDLSIHGVAMRPSSPAGMGLINDHPVFLLPGNPVSCLCAYDFFARIVIRTLSGLNSDWPYRKINLPLANKISSAIGRTDYARVGIVEDRIEPIAISGASILSSTIKASGFCIVPQDCEGFAAGTNVEVYCYD